MNLHQIILELGRIQQLRNRYILNFRIPIQPNTRTCPRCDRDSYNVLEFQLPALTPGALDATRTTDVENALTIEQRIIEGHCNQCGFDWWREMCALEPESKRNPLLAHFPPLMRYDQPCTICKEPALLGFFRMGKCTGGMCLFCRKYLVPSGVHETFTKRRTGFFQHLRSKENILVGILRTIVHPTIAYTDEPLVSTDEYTLWND